MWPWSRPAAPALPDPKEACTFCKRPRAQVAQLVAGDVASICDECVLLSVRVLTAVSDQAPERPKGPPFLFRVLLDALGSFPEDTPNGMSGPFLEAATQLADGPRSRARVGEQAARLCHVRAAANALVGPGSTPTMLANAAGFLVTLGEGARARALLEAVDPTPLAAEDRAQRAINLASAALAAEAAPDEVERFLDEAERQLHAAEGSPFVPAWWACVDLSRGDLALRRGDAPAARACYERALSRPEQHGAAERWRLGEALWALGDHEAARTAWRESLAATHPDHPRAEKLRRRLAESDTLGG